MSLIPKIFLPSIFFIFSACALRGTEGGNPKNSAAGQEPAIGIFSRALTEKICSKRNSCLEIVDANCQAETNKNGDMTFELGVNSVFPTMTELISSEEQSLILVNEPEYQKCTDAISELDCSDSLATDAFGPPSYSRIQVILRSSPSCGNTFKVK